MRHGMICCVVCMLLLSGVACGGPEKEFAEAERTNTIEAFEAFIEKHPDTEQANRAADRICKLELAMAAEAETLAAFDEVIRDCPALTEEAEAGIAALMGEITGQFVDANTGRPLDYSPLLFQITQGLTEEERALIDKYSEPEVSALEEGRFSAAGVAPGEYVVMAQVPAVGPKTVTDSFSVTPGESVDLGAIEVERR